MKLSSRFPRVKYCFDNDAIHKGAVLDKEITNNKLPLPPHSPDLNKPVEHAFNTIKSRWRDLLLLDSKILKPQEYMDRLQCIYKELVTDESIQKDVHSLKQTYRWVGKTLEQGGSEGHYPPKHLR